MSATAKLARLLTAAETVPAHWVSFATAFKVWLRIQTLLACSLAGVVPQLAFGNVL